jgi:hypothetical protein
MLANQALVSVTEAASKCILGAEPGLLLSARKALLS